MTDTERKNEPAKARDAFALEQILAAQPELFCDMMGQPRIRLPPSRDHPDEEPWSLRSARVRGWIAELLWDHSNLVLLDREIDRILNILEGKAWRDQRRDIELLEAVEQDAVLEAILLLMERETLFVGTVTKLQQELVKVAKRAGLDAKGKTWPKGSPQLSGRITRLESLLSKAGIAVERDRNSLQRKIILRRRVHDDPASGASPGPSVDKSHHPKGKRQNDAPNSKERAERFARLNNLNERNDS
jgi:hypothetical protein